MKLEYLAWDSVFFQKKIGRIDYKKVDEAELSALLEDAHNDNYKLIYLFASENIVLSTEFLKKESGKLVDRKIVYVKNIKEDISTPEEEVVEYKNTELSIDLENLAYLSGIYSRFRLDENFRENDFYNLYKTWISKSLTKEMADKIFIVEDDGHIMGMVTLKYKNTYGEIGLISVSDKYQGKGIGRKLLNACIYDLKKQNIFQIEIPTQLDNLNACNFYQRCGFEKKSVANIYHFWNLSI